MVSLDNVADTKPVARPMVLPVVFTISIFVSASLLFFVQPLFAKLVLPQIGGAPAVWTTAMLFFQVVLLAGYVYAHLLSKHVPLRWQLPLHLAFWAFALTFLPLSIHAGWTYDAESSTTWQTLTLFALGVGVPFGMLSANAPLLQAWYARTSGPSANDPYFLYGSSNFGSLLALLAFPLIVDPFFGVQSIAIGWAALFVIFGLFLAASGVLALRNPGAVAAHPTEVTRPQTKLRARQIALWMFFAFVPSSLMLAVTTKVSTDMGALPLIWAVPLAIYIFTFAITFTNRPVISDRILPVLSAGACAVMAIQMSTLSAGLPTWISALLFAPMLFIVATFAHRRLYQMRPESGHLTVFYICMSVGGAAGGLFNSILAPSLFDHLHEGWISVICATAIGLVGARRLTMRPLAFGLLLAGAALYVFEGLPAPTDKNVFIPLLLLSMAVFALAAARLATAPAALLLAISAVLIVDMISDREEYHFEDRSFFGAHKVFDLEGLRLYANGTTVHGLQRISDLQGGRPVPQSYYHPNGPMAQVLTASEGIETARVAVVGLGVGSLACYATPGQDWQFYEIDRMVDDTARNPHLFTFMSECAPGSSTHLGDARIVLAQQDYVFDVMVLDAYSSDSIPMHLITTEAVAMYRDRLAPDGQMVFHISNRYYDLSQPLSRIARDLGMGAVLRRDHPDRDANPGAHPSVVMVLSPEPARLRNLLTTGEWSLMQADDAPAWTDNRHNPLSALK